MIEININQLRKGEQCVNVKGHKSGKSYVKPHIKGVK